MTNLMEKAGEERSDLENNHFYFSDALECPRKVYFRRRNPRPFSLNTYKTLFIGKTVHRIFQFSMKGDSEIRVKIEDTGLKITGKADKVLPSGEVIEFKTTGNIHFQSLVPVERHMAQLNLFIKALKAEKGRLVYIDKRSLVTVEYEMGFDLELYDRTTKGFHEMNQALEKDELPRMQNGYMFGTFPCKLCSFKGFCKEALRRN